MITLNVPSGIGDISWIYSKLVNSKKVFRLIVCGDQPRRSLPFVELLPGLSDGNKYGDFSYWPTFRTKKLGMPIDTDLDRLADGGIYYLSANLHLDNGGKLADFLPSQETTYHYKINLTNEMKRTVGIWLAGGNPKPLIGIYTSKYNSYKGEWKFWSPTEWADFIEKLHKKTGGTFVFIGAEFDLDLGVKVMVEVKKRNIPLINLIGHTHIGECWHLLTKLDYLFAYASGIGILGDVVDTPTMHFLPTPRHDALCDTYADPLTIENGRHINKTFCSVDEAFGLFIEGGLEWIV